MKVSVIVPVYNTSQYLPKCLDSLLNQTLEEIEIIVVNDGSKDNSQEIIEKYASKSSKIKFFQKENGGLSDARNFGVEKSTGDFVGFVDSDDFVDEKMFEELYKLAVKHGAEMAICDLEKVNENGEVFRGLPQSPQLPERIDLKSDFRIFGEMGCFACNKLFQKELFQNHQFKKGIHFEDIELIPQLVLESTVIAKINEPFYKYFERQDSITKTHTEKGLDMFLAIRNVKNSFEKSAYKEQKIELKRFFILQGFYSYLAYVAYVKDQSLKKKMLRELGKELTDFDIKKWELVTYRRFNENYLLSLPLQKMVYYLLYLINQNLTLLIR